MIRALLNDEGKKVWGYVFPDGGVPVKSVGPVKAQLGDIGEEDIYLVDWPSLAENQRLLIIEHLKKRFGDSAAAVKAEILKTGLPLRAKYVSCTSIPGRFF
jgi:hypothetical protein